MRINMCTHTGLARPRAAPPPTLHPHAHTRHITYHTFMMNAASSQVRGLCSHTHTPHHLTYLHECSLVARHARRHHLLRARRVYHGDAAARRGGGVTGRRVAPACFDVGREDVNILSGSSRPTHLFMHYTTCRKHTYNALSAML